ncbi:MAG: hypothetical protein LBP64_11145 [Tannerella sp.]|jgi:hypothetical protein|nr:hypothetical protein [Tannerella sp.]
MKLRNGIHVRIREHDGKNTNFMILLGYIIMSHPDWKKSHLKIFLTSTKEDFSEVKEVLEKRIAEGRLPITLANIEFVTMDEGCKFSDVVEKYSSQAALTIVGFHEDRLKHDPMNLFTDFNNTGDLFFVNSSNAKEIK